MRLLTSMNFDHIHPHWPGPTSAQQKRNQHSTHQCSLCSQSHQKSAQVPCRNLNLNNSWMYGSLSWLKTCSIESRCRKHWVHPWPDAWHCQNRTAWGFQTQDQAEDSGGKKVMNFCLQCHDQATWGLMSLWQMPFEWMYARDLEVNRVHTLAQASLSNVKILKKWISVNLKSWYM